ncbi:MAG: hypothetical protein JNM85_08820 [Chthonomonas sp.]|nr:hypothetical protein [Chthonomonas sp.]
MELVLGILALTFALIAMVLGAMAFQQLRALNRNLGSLSKQLDRMDSKLASQEKKLKALEDQSHSLPALPGKLGALVPLLLGGKNRGAGQTAALVALNVLQGFLSARKQRTKALVSKNQDLE